MSRAGEADAAEDKEFGADKRGDELPTELQRRESRLRRIREAKVELEKEAAEGRAAALRDNAEALRKKLDDRTASPREKAAAKTLAAKSDKSADEISARDDDDDDGPTKLAEHRVQATPDGKPKDKAQRNFTDSESRIMIRNGVFLQAFNAQAAVSEDQIIVAHGVTNDGTDAQHLAPMLERIVENCGAPPKILSADTGYLSEANITYCAKRGVDAYIATRKTDAEKLFASVPSTPALITHWSMHDKVASSRGKKIYALRKILVEPVFGQIKSAMGFRHFSLRSLGKSASEWGIVCTCHNLLKLFRSTSRAFTA